MAEKHSLNAKLDKALENNETETVSQMCEEVDEHGLHILTILDNTVLHMATYANKSELVLRLLQELPNHHFDKLGCQNQLGDTILHMTAVSNDKAHEVARKLLEKAPGLGKFLGSLKVWWNGAPSFHINDGPHHEFNKRILPWMWEEGTQFSMLREYLRIIHWIVMHA